MLGRSSNNLKTGIIGLANIGKSTFFQAITNSTLGNPANYPFATIKPSQAVLQIPNPHLDTLQRLYGAERIVHDTLTVWDIAGLTRDASLGKGLGNLFLNDIRGVDGLFHIVRNFTDDNVTHLEGSVNPVRDLEIVQDELILKDLEFLESAMERDRKKSVGKKASDNDVANIAFELEFLEAIRDHLYEGKKIYNFRKQWTDHREVDILNKFNFLTAKPSMILLNCDAKPYVDGKNIPHLDEVKEWTSEFAPADLILPFSASVETAINKYKRGETREIDPTTYNRSALPDIIVNMKSLLGLISFYTCGDIEVKQWNIKRGTTAEEAAGVIHSDLQRTFISASIIKFDDIKDIDPPLSLSSLKSKGLIKRCGRDYVMEDEDIALFHAASGKSR